jgi:hypothetical protein
MRRHKVRAAFGSSTGLHDLSLSPGAPSNFRDWGSTIGQDRACEHPTLSGPAAMPLPVMARLVRATYSRTYCDRWPGQAGP